VAEAVAPIRSVRQFQRPLTGNFRSNPDDRCGREASANLGSRRPTLGGPTSTPSKGCAPSTVAH
jgi:hypothetical protein